MIWTIVSWIILGAVAGFIASALTGTGERVNGTLTSQESDTGTTQRTV